MWVYFLQTIVKYKRTGPHDQDPMLPEWLWTVVFGDWSYIKAHFLFCPDKKEQPSTALTIKMVSYAPVLWNALLARMRHSVGWSYKKKFPINEVARFFLLFFYSSIFFFFFKWPLKKTKTIYTTLFAFWLSKENN